MATHGQALETEYQNASKNHEACFKISDSICQEKSLWLEMEKKECFLYNFWTKFDNSGHCGMANKYRVARPTVLKIGAQIYFYR